jgi:hypothetical protein
MLHLINNALREADSTGVRYALKPGRNVDPVAKYIVAIADNITKINANAVLNTVLGGDRTVALGHPLLEIEAAAHSVDDATKFHKQTVARRLNDLAAMLFDFGIYEVSKMRLHGAECAFLVHTHQTGITRNVRGDNRRQSTLYAVARHWLIPSNSQIADMIMPLSTDNSNNRE